MMAGKTERSDPGDGSPGGHRYPVVAGLLLLLMVAVMLQRPWYGDFWEHAAVNRALAEDPMSPEHPIVDLDAPHAFYSPYALFWGLVGRLTGLGPISVLGIAGIANLLLLMGGLRQLVAAYDPERTDSSATYALLFMVLLWGPEPWVFSGSFQLGCLANVAPYPSTFATGITFFALAVARARLGAATRPWLVGLCVVSWIILLSHPLTFLFLAAGLGAAALGTRRWRPVVQVAIVIVVAATATAVWPYYSFWQLVTCAGEAFAGSNVAMFDRVIPRILPGLVCGLPFLVTRLRRDTLDPPAVTAITLMVVYLTAVAIGHDLLARTILFLSITLQIIAGIGVAEIEEKLARGTTLRRVVFAVLVVALASATAFRWTVATAFNTATRGTGLRFERFAFLHRHLGQGDVVLAKARRGWYVPLTGAKVVAPRTPLAFVSDLDERFGEVKRFFQSRGSTRERAEIIARRRVTHVMMESDRGARRERVLTTLGDRLELVEKRGTVSLFRVVEPSADEVE